MGSLRRDRAGGCEGVHDPLFARALYVTHEGEEALVPTQQTSQTEAGGTQETAIEQGPILSDEGGIIEEIDVGEILKTDLEDVRELLSDVESVETQEKVEEKEEVEKTAEAKEVAEEMLEDALSLPGSAGYTGRQIE